MGLTILGDHPLARDPQGNLKCRIATIFLQSRVLVTLPGVHATQRLAYSAFLRQGLQAQGLPPLTEADEMLEWDRSVDLITENDCILIRPDPDNMDQAFEADDSLQELVPKQRIRFLHVMNARVRHAITRRGELWRITPLPRTPDEMARMITDSRIRLAGPVTYYYNRMTGTRLLTCQEFASLAALPDAELAAQLEEIRQFSGRRNRMYHPEMDFFLAGGAVSHRDLASLDFAAMAPAELRGHYAALAQRFQDAVPPDLREDNARNLEWRNRMFSALIASANETIADEILRGISPEFFLQIEWLPGGRIEGGELVLDSIFEEQDRHPEDPELRALCDQRITGFIFRYLQQFGNLEYLNIGRVAGSLLRQARAPSAHRVYIAEVKHGGDPKPVVRIIRMQKWGIVEHLEQEGKDLLKSILEAEEYTDFILDRRLGCWQLGMTVPNTVATAKISEKYHGSRREYEGQMIWSTYFERDYIAGIATDKLPVSRYRDPGYAQKLAALFGRAAAPNLIVGRQTSGKRVLFDDGDEVVLEDEFGMPSDIVVADHAGTFGDYETPLEAFADDYAQPVNRRLELVSDPAAFAQAYLDAFLEHFTHIRQDYRKRRRAFDTLFKHRRRDPGGSFAYRWEKVLERLDHTEPAALTAAIRRCIRLPAGPSGANAGQRPELPARP